MGARGRRDYAGGACVFVRICVCVYCTHVSGYAAHRKQTAANPLHTRGKTTTHKANSRHKKSKTHIDMNTHTNKTSLKQCPVHRCVLKCHVHTHRFVHIRRTLPLHSKHTHSPTHMKNKHSHEIHPHMKTHTQS